ncbi:MAG: ATP-binding protein [Chitinophagaceae bacterium]
MKEKYSSIKAKLLRIVLITSGVVLFLTCTAFFAYEFFTFRQTTKDQLSTLAKIIAANSTAALAFESPNDAYEILQAVKAESHIVAACLFDKEGKLFAKYPSTLTENTVPRYPGADGYDYINAHLEGFEPVIQQDIRVGTLYLKSDMKAINKRFRLYATVALLVVFVAICVAYPLSRQLQKTLSDPILALAKTAGTVSNEQDYTVRGRKYSNDELGDLTDAFNLMLTRIERQNKEITSFNHALEMKVNERTTELEMANTALKLKNEFVETIIDSSVDVIAVFDNELRFVIFNKYAQQVYGLTSEEVFGKTILEVFPSLEESQLYKDLKKSLQGELVYNHYYKSFILEKILENFYIPLLDKDGNVYSILVIGHDITQIVNATEKLSTLNKELAMSNRDLEQFAYVASHDLQEPLRKIQTYSTLLEKEAGDEAASKKYTPRIISSVIRMRELIVSILNYSQASNTNGKFERVELNEIVANIKVDYELLIDEKKAVVTAANLPAVEGDKLQLHQLFLNLISNSLKFSQIEPQVTISFSLVGENELKEHPFKKGNENYFKLTFKDNGIGFEQQFADRIFTIFQRLHTRQEYPGTGIGLALCKRIVENHKGLITVHSKPLEGTLFNIYLPASLLIT